MAAFRPRERDEFMAHWTTNVLGSPTAVVRTIEVEGKIAGNVVSFDSPATGKREVGYWIGREFWGRGVATAALRRFLEVERTRPLYAGVATHNVASIRVLEKCGFTIVEEDLGPSELPRDGDVDEVFLRLG